MCIRVKGRWRLFLVTSIGVFVKSERVLLTLLDAYLFKHFKLVAHQYHTNTNNGI